MPVDFDLWRELLQVFQIKPGATLALVFRSTQHAAAVQSFPSEVYRFPEFREVEAGLADAGFFVAPAASEEHGANAHLLVATRLA